MVLTLMSSFLATWTDVSHIATYIAKADGGAEMCVLYVYCSELATCHCNHLCIMDNVVMH